ncbi:MAG: hypothetical protein QOK17_28 [Sphingomonadales bacterium]|nr:hypothetical protein [Sphingomonadales bacterium]
MPTGITGIRTIGQDLRAVLEPKPRVSVMPVTFLMPSRRLFPASWHDVRVSINDPKLKATDIVYAVECPGDPKDHTCLISVARDPASSGAFRLLVGPRPGVYALVARHRIGGATLARASFRIDPRLPLGSHGPSCWLRPTDGPPGVEIGGGPEGVQNAGAIANLRGVTWKIAVVLMEYDDAAFPADAAERQKASDRWEDMLVNGVAFDGVTAGVKGYVEESSLGQTHIDAAVLGFAKVKGAFTDFFDPGDVFPKPGVGGNPDPLPAGTKQYQTSSPKDWQALVSSIDGILDLNGFDSVFFVSPNHQPAGETFERFSWPTATGGGNPFKVAEKQPDGSLVSVDIAFGAFVMPDSFDMVKPTFTTICHELHHNFGLADQYTPAVQGDTSGSFRNVGGWDLMDYEGNLAHCSLFHKLALGWLIDPAASAADRDKVVRSIDFSKVGQGSETVKIAPLELPLPAGFHHGLEIRISSNRNYYFEYRRRDPALVGDRLLLEQDVVVGIDAMRDPGGLLAARPQLLLLSSDPDGDSSVLGKNEDYEQTDIVGGDVPMALRVEVVDLQPSHAELKATFEVQAYPNPSLTPWNTIPDRWWQSPDIEVRNDRTEADPTNYANKLWLGHPNTIVARVTNNGGADAPGVKLSFAVKDFTLAGGAETPIGGDVKDVPAGTEVEFTTAFTPPAGAAEDAHYCIVARIAPYLTPGSATLESDVYDNIAQSNYAGLTSVMASPPTRPATHVHVSNPFDAPTRVHVLPSQQHGGFISYLSARWLRLGAKAERKIAVATEYAPLPSRAMGASDQFAKPSLSPERKLGIRARLTIGAWAEAPRDRHPRWLNGVDLDLQAGFATGLSRIAASARAHRVEGQVMRVGAQTGAVAGGKILLIVNPNSRARRGFATAVAKGKFRFDKVDAAAGTPFELHYLGGNGEGPSSSTSVMEA